MLSQIQLFLVDEVYFRFPRVVNSSLECAEGFLQVHILNESRGSTLEVVISRMKTRGSSVRFVLVSATVPNIEDIASWIGDAKLDGSAKVFKVCRNINFWFWFGAYEHLVWRGISSVQTHPSRIWDPPGEKS